MSLRSRVKKLTKAIPARDRGGPETDDEWLDTFRHWLDVGCCDHEPDFPTAVQYFIDCLASDGPSKTSRRTQDALFWLLSIGGRVHEKRPPIAEVDFDRYAAWFHANEGHLPWSRGSIKLPDGSYADHGTLTSRANTLWYRSSDGEELYWTLKQLFEMFVETVELQSNEVLVEVPS